MIPILRMEKKTDEDYPRGFRWEIVLKTTDINTESLPLH